ncbi:SOS response-associated peptidase [Brevibacterium jeotgali]|uniref:Abasic site processing protein n=1 Tax=Brevibacterium jeotgali TaxID=1262550 RepID=A0A2H1L716_9MICO|nr:SOS response-associated peptidase [Brevibacterium jeotgali]TWB98995.1 putative SOS response-associated peptidase YedK [Brevibacterium jeotgali]SMY12173.1 Putative SOS response-associated peptidase YedK [Brevibacterium jeotgali]
MCGRINMALDPSDLIDELGIDHSSYEHRERYNVPPGGTVPIIVDRPDSDGLVQRRLEPARWGLVPGWAKDLKIGYRAFNARSESARSKPMFRSAFARQRAVVPVHAYYEWVEGPQGKQPWMMHAVGHDHLFMAGLFEFKKLNEEWSRDVGMDAAASSGWLVSATILTQQAQGHLAEVHARMPVMLSGEQVGEWIDPTADAGAADEFLSLHSASFDPRTIGRYAVGTAVGNVRNEGPELAQPV